MADRMQPLDAIVAAGRPVALVARPGGVTHLYTGPLTQTGMVPRDHRPVCNAHTRRLYDRSSYLVRGALRVCVRCSARMSTAVPAARTEHRPSTAGLTMADDRQRYEHLSPVDIYLSVRFAVSEDELDECSVALQLCFTPEEQVAEYESPTGRPFRDLPKVIEAQRTRIRPPRPSLLLPTSLKNDPAYWDAVRQVDQARSQARSQARPQSA
jgi:hypothetical protein